MRNTNLSEKLSEVAGKLRCVAPFFRQGKEILIGLRHYNSGPIWTTPGGKCDVGEHFEQSIRREVYEEVGLEDISIHEYLGDVIAADGLHTLSVFICESSEAPRLMEPDKFSEWRWCHVDEIPENFINPPALKLVRDYLHNQSGLQQKESYSPYFLMIAMMFVAVLLISNTVAVKIAGIGPFNLDGGNILFPLSYIFGDILTEVYGYRASRRIIWGGFIALILMSACYYAVQILPSASFWAEQKSYEAILGLVPRITLGSILGYFSGEFCNSYVLSKMKIWTKGKHLWMRTIGSTIAGEGVDTIVFMSIAFLGVVPASEILMMSVMTYLVKVALEVVLTPVTYQVVAFLKQKEGVDVYDAGIRYTPFSLK